MTSNKTKIQKVTFEKVQFNILTNMTKVMNLDIVKSLMIDTIKKEHENKNLHITKVSLAEVVANIQAIKKLDDTKPPTNEVKLYIDILANANSQSVTQTSRTLKKYVPFIQRLQDTNFSKWLCESVEHYEHQMAADVQKASKDKTPEGVKELKRLKDVQSQFLKRTFLKTEGSKQGLYHQTDDGEIKVFKSYNSTSGKLPAEVKKFFNIQ